MLYSFPIFVKIHTDELVSLAIFRGRHWAFSGPLWTHRFRSIVIKSIIVIYIKFFKNNFRLTGELPRWYSVHIYPSHSFPSGTKVYLSNLRKQHWYVIIWTKLQILFGFLQGFQHPTFSIESKDSTMQFTVIYLRFIFFFLGWWEPHPSDSYPLVETQWPVCVSRPIRCPQTHFRHFLLQTWSELFF